MIKGQEILFYNVIAILIIILLIVILAAIFFYFAQKIKYLINIKVIVTKQEREVRKENIELNMSLLEKKEKIENEILEYTTKKKNIDLEQSLLNEKKIQLENFREKELLKLSSLTEQEAKEELFSIIQTNYTKQLNNEMHSIKEKMIAQKRKIATDILVESMESLEGILTSEKPVEIIDLPEDDFKGKIIGKEGRNIKTLENCLGVNVIIDDTPKQISVSSFNPKRREIAVRLLKNCIKMGKINQSTIEEKAKYYEKEVEDSCYQNGFETVETLKINGVSDEMIEQLGNLEYRSSYGQNVLKHSVESAKIARNIAQSLSLDTELATRCALFHDIGKYTPVETELSHVELGTKIARQYGENEIVINAIESHHGDVEPTSVYAVITAIADKISASRPGARVTSFEHYIERIKALEKIALDFKEVSKAYALQGGREVRIIVESESCPENEMNMLGVKIQTEIEKKLEFPGVIKINVIREARILVEARKGSKNE